MGSRSAPSSAPEQPGFRTFVRRVQRGRCPQCGEGELFRRFARLHDACAPCGLVYRRESGAMTGSMYLSAAVTEVFAAVLALSVFLLTDWSVAVQLALGIPLVLVFTAFCLPRSMATWVAIEYWTDVHNRERWARPR